MRNFGEYSEDIYYYSNSDTWKELYKILKNHPKINSLRKISEYIGTDFRNVRYKNCGLQEQAFAKLKELFNSDIEQEFEFSASKRYQEVTMLPSPELAEIFGIMLGDGHIGKNYFSITLNGEKEKEYIDYVKKLFKNTLGIDFFVYDSKNNKSIQLKSGNMSAIRNFVRLGLVQGDKVKQQVGVPKWIEENKEFQVKCIRGLFETDGSIYIKNRQRGYLALHFASRSENLLDFFDLFCKNNSIITYRQTSEFPGIYIQGQSSVRKFVEIVKPVHKNMDQTRGIGQMYQYMFGVTYKHRNT